jgi:hypothetical protein
MTSNDGWRYVPFAAPDSVDDDEFEAWSRWHEQGDHEPRPVHPDFVEPDNAPKVETVDPGDYL